VKFKGFIFLVLLLVIATAAFSIEGYDKYLHFSVSFTAYGISRYFFGEVGGFLFTTLLGVGKEAYDFISGRGCAEFGDLIADFTGTYFGHYYCSFLSFRPILIFYLSL